MTRPLTAIQVKARLFELLKEVENGAEIEITRGGRTVARLIPPRPWHRLRGMFAGVVRTNATDEELYSTGERWEAQ